MNLTVAQITVRGLLGRRRLLVLLALPALLVGLAFLVRAMGTPSWQGTNLVLLAFGLMLVVPLTSLVVGTGVLGPEIDDGTLLHILATPVRRASILGTKMIVAAGVTVIVVAPALALSGVLVGGARTAAAFAAAGAVSAVVYCSAFATLSLVSRRPILVGLGYLLVWEEMLCQLIPGAGVLSVTRYSVTIASRLSGSGDISETVSLPVALIMSVVFLGLAVWLGVNRLRSFGVAGSTS